MDYRTEIKLPGEGIDYKWTPNDGKDDSKFWSNVEFNKYGNGIDTSQFRTKAHQECPRMNINLLVVSKTIQYSCSFQVTQDVFDLPFLIKQILRDLS